MINDKTYLERISASFSEGSYQLEALMEEHSFTVFMEPIPTEFTFLRGGVVRNRWFGNLGLTSEARKELHKAYLGNGVVVPGTNYRMRYEYMLAVIEDADGTEEASLPDFWRESMFVCSRVENIPTWIGRRVPIEDIVNFDVASYVDNGEALVPQLERE